MQYGLIHISRSPPVQALAETFQALTVSNPHWTLHRALLFPIPKGERATTEDPSHNMRKYFTARNKQNDDCLVFYVPLY